jgi:hypothetical protein
VVVSDEDSNNRTLYSTVKVANEQIALAFNEMYELSYVVRTCLATNIGLQC